MEYEIWGMDKKDTVMECYVSCKGSEVDKNLIKLVKEYPGKKWMFGMHIHFRRDVDGDVKVGW